MKKYKIDDIAKLTTENGLIILNDYLNIHGDKIYSAKTLNIFITSVLIPTLIHIGYIYNLNDEIGLTIYNKFKEVLKDYEKRSK